MYITDFTYDNISLNSLGYVVCLFNRGGQEEISNGSNIDFKTVPNIDGSYSYLAHSAYSECITATFQICKDMCVANYDPAMTVTEISRLSSWLGRKQYHKLTVNAPGYEDIFFEGSFTKISRVEFNGIVIGLTLEFTSNRPYALRNKRSDTLTFTEGGDQDSQILNVYTDVLGSFYPKITIVCGDNGDMALAVGDPEEVGDYYFAIGDCTAGETLTVDYPMVSSDDPNHNLTYHFTWFYPMLSKSTVGEYEPNTITVSMPCTVTFEYYPAVNISI